MSCTQAGPMLSLCFPSKKIQFYFSPALGHLFSWPFTSYSCFVRKLFVNVNSMSIVYCKQKITRFVGVHLQSNQRVKKLFSVLNQYGIEDREMISTSLVLQCLSLLQQAGAAFLFFQIIFHDVMSAMLVSLYRPANDPGLHMIVKLALK